MWSMSDWKTVCITFLLILKAAVTNPDSGVHAWWRWLWKSGEIFVLVFSLYLRNVEKFNCHLQDPHLRSKWHHSGDFKLFQVWLDSMYSQCFYHGLQKSASKSVPFLVKTKRGDQIVEYLDDIVVLAELVVVRVSLPEIRCELFQSSSDRHHHCHSVRLQDKEN